MYVCYKCMFINICFKSFDYENYVAMYDKKQRKRDNIMLLVFKLETKTKKW